ncbi:hypothetical protein RCL1_000434 [Eukaryota sp. TZLM3-RCL]
MDQSIDLRKKLSSEKAIDSDCHLKSKVNFTLLNGKYGLPYCLFNLTIEHVPGAGRGVFFKSNALHRIIPSRTIICRYFGELITSNDEITERSQEWEALHPISVSFKLKVGEHLEIDATNEIDCIAR